MADFFLILDSSVIIQDPWLDSPGGLGHVLESRCFGHRLVLPGVVLREVVAKYRQKLASAARRASRKPDDEAALAALRSLTRNAHADADVDQQAALNRYEDHLRERVAWCRGTVAPIPDVSHEEIVDRTISAKRPFRESGDNGYRDYLIWKTVLGLVTGTPYGCASFITKNHRDFASDVDELHQQLVEDVKASNTQQWRVRLFTSVRGFIRHMDSDPEVAARALLGELLDDEFPAFNLRDWLEAYLPAIYNNTHQPDAWDCAKMSGVPVDFDNAHLVYVERLVGIDGDLASRVDESTYRLEIDVGFVGSFVGWVAFFEVSSISRRPELGYRPSTDGESYRQATMSAICAATVVLDFDLRQCEPRRAWMLLHPTWSSEHRDADDWLEPRAAFDLNDVET